MAEPPEPSKNPESSPRPPPLMGGPIKKKSVSEWWKDPEYRRRVLSKRSATYAARRKEKEMPRTWTAEARAAAAERMRKHWKNPRLREAYTVKRGPGRPKGVKDSAPRTYTKTTPVLIQARRVEGLLIQRINELGTVDPLVSHTLVLISMIKGEV